MTREASHYRSLLGILLVVLAELWSCASHRQGYPGPERPPRELAYLQGANDGLGCIPRIEQINGSPIFYGFEGPTEGVHLLPGSYDLELSAVCSVQVSPLASVVVGLHIGRRTVPLTVEAGHRYYVDYNPTADFYVVRPIAIGQQLPTPREIASDDPGLDRCLLAPTELDRSRCEAWLQE